MGVLEDLAAEMRRVSAQAGPSVVAVGRAGSGIVVGAGLVATNAHNMRGPEPEVRFADGRRARATVAGADIDGDLAVLAVDTGSAPAVRWADHAVEPGAAVVALANPGGSGVRATVGTVSAVDQAFHGPRGRRIAGGIEHTAPLAPGSSGGPLLDGDGAVVGINTHRLGDGFYLAQPADERLVATLSALGRGETRSRLRLGVAVAPAGVARRLRAAVGLEPRDGLLVRGVEEGGPAHAAGIRQGDLIVSVGGRPTSHPDDLHTVLDGAEPGAALEVVLVRGSDELTVSVTPAADAPRPTGG